MVSDLFSQRNLVKLQGEGDAATLQDLVVKEASVTNPDEKLTLIHILNTLDSLIERIDPKPSAEIAQQVYHNLLN